MQSNKKLIGEYILCVDEKLGSGSFGEVFKGYKKTDPSCLVAIKQVNINVSERELEFLRNLLETEVSVMKALDDECVLRLIDVKMTSNNIYIITEFCNGGDIDGIKEQLSVKEALIIVKQVTLGMLYANSKNVIHRDLKPANILIHDGKIKIADFGFARFVEDPNVNGKMTMKKGSPLYMAPQVYFGEKYDSKCDVWSLGIMLYEMIFKEPPWYGSSAPDLFNNNIKKKKLKFPSKSSVDDSVIDLIENMLQLNQKERFSFQDILDHEVIKKKMPSVLEKWKKK